MPEGCTEALQKAFDIALMQFGVANSITVALENINAPTNTATPYLAGFLLPAPVEDADLHFTDRRRGIYQIDVHYASHLGSAPINKMIDLLNAAFKPSTTIQRSPICAEITNFSCDRVIIENGWATKPVSIRFEAYTARL